MILSLLERLEQQGGSTEWRAGGLRASVVSDGEAGDVTHGGRWFRTAGEADLAQPLASAASCDGLTTPGSARGPAASSSGRMMSNSSLVAERTDDGVFVAPLQPGTRERIVWVGDLELNSGSARRLGTPRFEVHRDGMGLDLTWAITEGTSYGRKGAGNAPQPLAMRLSLPCRPAGEITFTNDQLDPEVWLSATRAGGMAARMRPYAALPELEIVPTEGDLAFEAGPEWRLGLSVMDPDGTMRSEDRFSPGTFRWSVPAGSPSVSLSIRMVSEVAQPRAQRSGELGDLLARKLPDGDATESAAGLGEQGSMSADQVRDWALVLPGDAIRRGLQPHRAAAELRSLLLAASVHVTGPRFDVALWASRAAFLMAPTYDRDVTSVTLPFLRGVMGRIEDEAKAAGCPGAAAAELPRWCTRSGPDGDGGGSMGPKQIPIEYAALLHQAVAHAAQLAEGADDGAAAQRARRLSRRLRRWFQAEFWLARPDRARDLGVVGRTSGHAANADAEGAPSWDEIRGLCLRPHMLLAASFEGAPFTTAQRRVLVRVTESRLLVPPLGLATLDHDDLEFNGYSPENGAVWPFLIGPFVEASLLAFGQDRGRRRMLMQLSSAPSLASAPMAWAHSGGKAVSPAPYFEDSAEHSGVSPRHPMPLGPLQYALNLAEGARAKRLLSSEGQPS